MVISDLYYRFDGNVVYSIERNEEDISTYIEENFLFPYSSSNYFKSYVKQQFINAYFYGKSISNIDIRHRIFSISNVALSRLYIWEIIPNFLKENVGSIDKARAIFDINNCLEHISNLYFHSMNVLNKFENIDIQIRLLELCLDDYMSGIYKMALDNNLNVDGIIKMNSRSSKINTLISQ